jgi:hypothetical protein
MAYIGNDPSNRFVAPKAASVFSGDGSTTAFTLDHAVGSDEDILVSVDGVIQEPSVAYAVSSGTTLTFTAAPSSNSGNNIFVYYLFRTVGTVSHPSNNALEATSGTFSTTLDVTGATTLSDDLTIPDKIIHDGDTNTTIRFPAADTVSFETGGSERARVDSNGSILVGTTSNDSADLGARMKSSGRVDATSDGGVASLITRLSSDGDVMSFKRGSSTVGTIATHGGSSEISFHGNVSGTCGLYMANSGRVVPMLNAVIADNAVDMGHPSYRFNDVYATNSTIQTSDKNEKQDIEELSDAEKRVAVVAKSLMKKFRFKDAVAEKGDKARTHFGIIAQDLEDAFKAEGLDASKYAMFCSNTWWEKEITVDAVKADKEKDIEAKDAYTYMDVKDEATEGYTKKTRLGVRYSELLAFIISAI